MQDKQDEKIQLHELCSYLPYGLQIVNTKSGRVIDIRGIVAGVDTFTLTAYIKDGKVFKDVDYQWDLWPFKPLVRQLSEFNDSDADHEVHSVTGTYYSVHPDFCTPLELPYTVFAILCKHHFDVYNLIGRGLAINLNTIK